MRPKLVLIEYNSHWGPEDRKVVPYDPDFKWRCDQHYGASARALDDLAKAKGYVLVGHTVANLLFVREDLQAGFKPVNVRTIPKMLIHPEADREMVDVAAPATAAN
jgi:hypothetical protein